MIQANKEIMQYLPVDVSLFISDNADELTVPEFFELVADLYNKMGYVNDVNIQIKGVASGIKDKIKIRPEVVDEY